MRPGKVVATAAVAALVTAAVCFGASAQAGASVQLWACHGPGGEALGTAPFTSAAGRDGVTGISGLGCAGSAGSGGLLASFSQPDPAGGSAASWQLAVPSGVALDSLRIVRSTSGFGGSSIGGDPQVYEATTSSASIESATLESSATNLLGELLVPSAAGRYVRLGVDCALPGVESCTASPAGTVGVNISSIALGVTDSSPPAGAVGGVRSPASGMLNMVLQASDPGLGLANAEASIDGRNPVFVRLGSGTCPERPTSSATVEIPIDANCPKSVSGVSLSLDTTAFADGPRHLRVTVTDAAGNTATLVDEEITIRNTPVSTGSSATVLLGVGNQAPGAASEASGGVLGSSSSGGGVTPGGRSVACQLPQLSMRLVSKPLRYAKHHVPVLLARRHYVYRGRMTCLLNRRRVSAPTGTVLRVFYTLPGRNTLNSGRGTMTVHNGNLRAILAYFNSRTIIFRYKPNDGEFAQVKLPIKVVQAVAGGNRHR